MTNPSHPPEYLDDHVRLAVEPPTNSRPTLNLTAYGVGIVVAVELSLSAAAGLAGLLLRAAADAAAQSRPARLGARPVTGALVGLGVGILFVIVLWVVMRWDERH